MLFIKFLQKKCLIAFTKNQKIYKFNPNHKRCGNICHYCWLSVLSFIDLSYKNLRKKIAYSVYPKICLIGPVASDCYLWSPSKNPLHFVEFFSIISTNSVLFLFVPFFLPVFEPEFTDTLHDVDELHELHVLCWFSLIWDPPVVSNDASTLVEALLPNKSLNLS